MTNTIKEHSFKIQIGTIITVLLFVVYATVSTMSAKSEVDEKLSTVTNQYEHCLKWYNDLEDNQEIIEDRSIQQEINIVEINTKLANIEVMLLEIKNRLK